MVRQLAESRDSLQFSNHLCEQLESKVDELETTNKHLAKLCRERLALLEQKRSNLAEVKEDLVCSRDECDGMRVDLEKMQVREEIRAERNGGALGTPCGAGGGQENAIEEAVALQGKVKALSLRVQSSDFQKKRLERELASALGENASLGRNLEKTEAEVSDLQLKFEELTTESRSQETVTSPNQCYHVTPASSPYHLSSSFALLRPKFNGALPHDTSFGQNAECPHPGNVSLFSELDTEYSSLQESYGDLVHTCTCSASLPHKKRHGGCVGGAVVGEEASSGGRDGPTGTGLAGGAFKELFEEMFCTLRQTAEVADRLIEKRVSITTQ